MKKILFVLSVFALIGVMFGYQKVAYAASVSNITPSIANPTFNQSYSARIKFFYDGSYGPNVTVSNLPPGITLANPSAGYTDSIYALNQRDSDGYYYIDLTGTPTQAGSYNIQVHLYDTTHTFDVNQNYSVTVQQSSMPSSANFITSSLPNGTVGQPYIASIEVSSNGQYSPNFIVSFLPAGITVSNASAGWPNSIYGDGTKDSNGYYHADLSGTPTQAGNSAVTVRVFNTNQTLDISKTYSLTVNPAPAPVNNNNNVASGQAHAEYTNVTGPDGTVYRIQSGVRYPYTSAGAFLSYGFNGWADVVPATTGDMALPVSTYTPSGSNTTATYFIPPRNGSLINDKGTVYLITNGMRIGFANEQAFLGLGYSYKNVQPGDASFMTSLAPINSSEVVHPDGTLINDHGTIYIMKNGYRAGFPSMQVFNSWGLKTSEVVPANSYDQAATQAGVVSNRMANQMSI
ncbi:MAG: hypothetical protein M1383_04550 [Patescibacteria group bacterium]|nr:hypothetical protein [Patescibacteria group bacterium]